MTDILLYLAPVAALPLGFLAGRLQVIAARIAGLAAVLLLPIAIYTADLLSYKPAPPGFFHWWSIGLMMLAPPFLLWCLAAAGGFLAGSASRQPPA